ncbi:MAG TPA: TonB-dependent receptor [Bacteroidales bacterium]
MQRILLFLLFTFIICVEIIAQRDILSRKVSVYVQNKRIADVVDDISKQSGVDFLYSPDLVDLERQITVNITNVDLQKVLQQLFRGTNVIYSIVAGQVVLKKKTQIPKHSISGFVSDMASGEKLAYATIAIQGKNFAVTSNNYGFYSLSEPEGFVYMMVSYVGYKSNVIGIELDKDTVINVRLNLDTTLVKDIIVNDNSWKQSLKNSQTGLNRLSMQSLRQLPQLLGENDLIKSLQTLPGVQTKSEGSSGMLVRGGNHDQNLYLLDGVPIYNINHLFGFVSVFNTDAVQHVSMYKSGFPARYNGRLSSVVDMKLKEGNSKTYQGKLSIGTLTSSASVEGPIANRGSFFIAGRRTYMDLLLKAMAITAKLNDQQDTMLLNFDANFYDLVAKANFKLSEKSHIYASTYFGQDIYGAKGRLNGDDESGWLKWDNLVTALRWNYKINNKLFVNNTLTYSNFSFDFNLDLNGSDSLKRKTSLKSDLKTGIKDCSVMSDWEWSLNDKHNLHFGLGATYHDFNAGDLRWTSNFFSTIDSINVKNAAPYAKEAYIYAEDTWKFSEKAGFTIGLNSAFFNVSKNIDFVLQPRISTFYLLTENLSLKSSYSRMGQFLHMGSTGSPSFLTVDIWVPLSQYVKPQISDQVSLGATYARNTWEINSELFWKNFTGLIEKKIFVDEYFGVLDWRQNWQVCSGKAYGLELMAYKRTGRFNGWLSYTLTFSDREYNSAFEQYHSPMSNIHKHLVHANANYVLSKKTRVSVGWTYGNGAMTTFPKQKYQSAFNDMPFVYYVDGLNTYKMPAYHRLDLNVSFTKKKKYYRRTWNIGVYNVYNNMNTNFVEIRKNKFVKTSYLGIIPSVSYVLEFGEQ